MIKRLYMLTILSGLGIAAHAQTNSIIMQGNKLYDEKKYKEASAEYEKALQKNPNNLPGIFNLGNSLYQQGQMDASRKVMAAAEKTAKNKGEKGQANYNIGNSYMAEKKWEDAVDYYKQALRNNPQDADAKYNLSYANEMMKQQQKNDKNKKDKNKKDQDKKDKQNKDNKDQNKKDEQNKDKQDKNKDQQDKQDQNKDQQHPQAQPSKLSEKQADQLLNALQQEEKKLQDKKQKSKGVPAKLDKDW